MCFKTRGSDTFEFFDENKRNVSIIARVFLSIIYLKADFYCFGALLVFSCRVQMFVMLLSELGCHGSLGLDYDGASQSLDTLRSLFPLRLSVNV